MIYNKKLSSKYFKGSWFSQTNIYVINSKIQKLFKKKLCLLSKNKIENSNILHNESNQIKAKNNIQGIVKSVDKIYTNKTINLTIQILDINLFIVDYNTINNNLVYKEYIYLINENLIFSTGILKDIKNYKYIGIIISSYIRLKK